MDSMEEILFEEDLKYHLFSKFVCLFGMTFFLVVCSIIYLKVTSHIVIIIVFIIFGIMLFTITILFIKRKRLSISKEHFIFKFFPFQRLFLKKIPIRNIYRILLNENSQEIDIYLNDSKKSITVIQIWTKDLRKIAKVVQEIGIPLEIIEADQQPLKDLEGLSFPNQFHNFIYQNYSVNDYCFLKNIYYASYTFHYEIPTLRSITNKIRKSQLQKNFRGRLRCSFAK